MTNSSRQPLMALRRNLNMSIPYLRTFVKSTTCSLPSRAYDNEAWSLDSMKGKWFELCSARAAPPDEEQRRVR
jgi:hypothetical protein